VRGAGLGLRRALLGTVLSLEAPPDDGVGFFEVAPENWMRLGGRLGRQFRACTERFRFVTHGLSLSIGAPAPLDVAFVQEIKTFLDQHGIADYTEHLTFCSDAGHLYDLMPIPFTEEAVDYVAARVRQVQDILERRIALENASYYAPLATDLSEAQFIRAVIERADCDLLLDVNNIVVNSINHRYDANDFLAQLPLERVRYAHIAGHYVEAEDLRVDTHGSDVDDHAWALLQAAYARLGPVPTLLERDFNLPPWAELMREIGTINRLQAQAVAEPAHG
jgi:uncharacterized protein (UPF0276 family)